MSTAELKIKAKEQLRGNWGIAVITILFTSIILNLGFGLDAKDVLQHDGFSFSVNLLRLFLGGVISTGLCKFLLNLARQTEKAEFKDVFSYFNIYLKTLGLNILVSLAIGVGLILFIVPGIIVALMFSQSFYILSEDTSKSITECINESVQMMKGHKGELFILELSFIGWWILYIITFGIAGLWIVPYVKVTEANYYLTLVNN